MTAPFVIRPGAAKQDPFTILVIANPAIQAPRNSATFIPDPILGKRQAFDDCQRYIESALFGLLAGQAEPMLGIPGISTAVRMLGIFDSALPCDDAHAFVAQDNVSDLLIARRVQIANYLVAQGILADVVYAVSASDSHTRASAWYTSDDEGRPGTPFKLNGLGLVHRHYYAIPGTVALHATSSSLTAAHEFQHAISSYQNGQIVDLYVDSPEAVNCRRPRPAPATFGSYQTATYVPDSTRAPLGYPAGWLSYHCELIGPAGPVMMDNYWLATPSESALNDAITRAFVLDRVRAKVGR